MSDKPVAAIPTIASAWRPSDVDLARAQDLGILRAQREREDVARAASPRITLVAITAFTIHDDENPLGRIVNMGDTIEVAECDRAKWQGKALEPANVVTVASTQPAVRIV